MHVEFFGVPRARAGVAGMKMHAKTLGQLLASLAVEVPAMSELIDGQRLRASFIANLNGDRFIRDPETPLGEEDRILILSADAGG
jgi:molybdopterin converting factor small subunit